MSEHLKKHKPEPKFREGDLVRVNRDAYLEWRGLLKKETHPDPLQGIVVGVHMHENTYYYDVSLTTRHPGRGYMEWAFYETWLSKLG